MTSLTDLREVVDVVIGVDTHVHTHSAAVVDAATGGVLDEITVEATAGGYAELVEFANNHAMLRAWAIEGTGGHGAGLSRHLLEISEIVIELDRPKRAARRNGAKSDPLDAIAARYRRTAAPDRPDGKPLSGEDRSSLKTLGLEPDADRHALRKRYSELVRRYHPDRNGGDRSHEDALQKVIRAYQQLRQAPAFA